MRKNPKSLFTPEKVLFVLVALCSVVITYFVTQNCIDSDAASELVLAQHLAKNGWVLSKDWIYSTELRVANTQLVFAPLFLLFHNWHTVRFVGAVVLQALLILSFFATTRLLQLQKKVFYWGGSLLLLPVSVAYGRIVLYNSYYVPHICFSMLIVGLTYALACKTAKKRILKAVALAILSFLGGLGGIRQLMMTHAPLVLSVVLLCFVADAKQETTPALKTKKFAWLIGGSVGGTLCAYLGYYLNKNLLALQYTFTDYSKNTIELLSADKIPDVFYGYLHHFGFRNGAPLLSAQGLLSVFAVALGIAFVALAACKLRKACHQGCNGSHAVYAFGLCYTVVMGLVFGLLGSQAYYFPLYYTPVVIWSVLAFVLVAAEQGQKTPLLNTRRLLSYACVVLLLVNGGINSVFFVTGGNQFNQKYEGLKFQNLQHTKQIEPVVSYLTQNGYTFGYATFWNSNILTELSNGSIQTVTVEIDANDGDLWYYDWLTLRSNRENKTQTIFLLLTTEEQRAFAQNANAQKGEVVYKDAKFVVYAFTNT